MNFAPHDSHPSAAVTHKENRKINPFINAMFLPMLYVTHKENRKLILQPQPLPQPLVGGNS